VFDLRRPCRFQLRRVSIAAVSVNEASTVSAFLALFSACFAAILIGEPHPQGKLRRALRQVGEQGTVPTDAGAGFLSSPVIFLGAWGRC
jgi:hypothetical protein